MAGRGDRTAHDADRGRDHGPANRPPIEPGDPAEATTDAVEALDGNAQPSRQTESAQSTSTTATHAATIAITVPARADM